jgi:hypothetical protein
MVFADGCTYYGSFSNNQLCSQRAVVRYGNGDKYKGQIDGNDKHGQGTYTFAGG